MKRRQRSISITSGKGGTGKTTVTANLGIALGTLGMDVTILDADLTMANLAIVMGMHRVSPSFQDVLMGRAEVKDALYQNYGVKVMPVGFRFEDVHEVLSGIRREKVEEAVAELLSQTEFLLIDAPAGIGDDTIISIAAAQETIPVLTPTYTSLVDGHKIIRMANLLGTWARGLVINRITGKAELTVQEIETFMGRAVGDMPILAEIPEDPKVQEAEHEGVPFIVYDPDCEASRAVGELAKVIAGESEVKSAGTGEPRLKDTSEKLLRVLLGRRA
ncbi:MAG: cell division ATPase MinD [Candidatus Hadarchaeales archaeon]